MKTFYSTKRIKNKKEPPEQQPNVLVVKNYKAVKEIYNAKARNFSKTHRTQRI